MKKDAPIIITISRQLGSGGAYIGHELSKALQMDCFDKEIVLQAAKKLSVLEEDLASRDEKIPSFWESFFQSNNFICPDVYLPTQAFVPTEEAIFNAESEIITHIANERSAIIIGRCGAHILRDNPHHISLFFHADKKERLERIEKLYGITADEAAKMIQQSDEQRTRYHRLLTDKEWTDVTQYDFAINTSKISFDKLIPLILSYLDARN